MIDIIFENIDFYVVSKPAGISFHQDQKQTNESSGFFNQISKQLGQKLWPVHRLDKMTSGLLIVAKNKESASLLGELFEQQKISKTYLAISDKKPKKKQGHIVGDMKKSRSGSWMLCHSKSKPARTRFTSYSLAPGIRLFKITPKTGKTHQIRVALKSIGSPILGDTRYAGSQADRGYLHAYQLEFCWKNEPLSIEYSPTEGMFFTDTPFKNWLTAK